MGECRAREAKNRELFERTFPELKKSREEKEKASRMDSRAAVKDGVPNPSLPPPIPEGWAEEEEERKVRAHYSAITDLSHFATRFPLETCGR